MLQIRANPPDINVLPENERDPRVISNLIDGTNRTQDDVYLWLAPFVQERPNTITIEFEQQSTIGMVRIWVSIIFVEIYIGYRVKIK